MCVAILLLTTTVPSSSIAAFIIFIKITIGLDHCYHKGQQIGGVHMWL